MCMCNCKARMRYLKYNCMTAHASYVCVCVQLAASIEAGLPPPLSRDRASVLRSPFAPLPSGHDNSLGTVLAQVGWGGRAGCTNAHGSMHTQNTHA